MNIVRREVVKGKGDSFKDIVELIARGFAWREWKWRDGHREDAPMKGPVVGSGEGVE